MYTGPIIDTHFHVFRRADIPQYMILSAAVVQRDFSLTNYREAMAPAHVVRGVIMQAADVGTGMDELAYIERLPKDPLVGRYVSYLPIDRDDAADIVDQLAGHDMVAGVRYSPSQAAELGKEFNRSHALRALAALAKHRMVYELSAYAWQHDSVYELAREAPDTTFVLCHMGKPQLEAASQADWYAGIERLASLPNIVCKISAPLVGPTDPPYRVEIMRPLVQHVAHSFGYDRIVFGSNFPVLLIATTCKMWLEMLDEFLGDASADELDKLYRRNATRVYRLPEE